jgi:hypothetical protein
MADCTTSHDVTDAEFCADVQIGGMTADGEILNVPTRLAPGERDRAQEICRTLAVAHFDTAGVDLGYGIIGIEDSAGGDLYACTV